MAVYDLLRQGERPSERLPGREDIFLHPATRFEITLYSNLLQSLTVSYRHHNAGDKERLENTNSELISLQL